MCSHYLNYELFLEYIKLPVIDEIDSMAGFFFCFAKRYLFRFSFSNADSLLKISVLFPAVFIDKYFYRGYLFPFLFLISSFTHVLPLRRTLAGQYGLILFRSRNEAGSVVGRLNSFFCKIKRVCIVCISFFSILLRIFSVLFLIKFVSSSYPVSVLALFPLRVSSSCMNRP